MRRPFMKDAVPATTLLNDEARALLIERLQRVRPDAQPVWGTLNAPRMLCHLADNLRVALDWCLDGPSAGQSDPVAADHTHSSLGGALSVRLAAAIWRYWARRTCRKSGAPRSP